MTRARVLVVDNDPQTCLDLRDLLEPFGFTVLLVKTDEADIVAQAIEDAQQQRPHVVLVDLRLQDDYTDEFSGLEVLRHMQSAHCILYSAYLTLDLIRTEKELLYDWIRKYDSPQVLRNAVKTASAEKAAAHSLIEVKWPASPAPEELARQIADVSLPPPPSQMLDDIVVQLCADARQVTLEPLKSSHRAPSGASRSHSAVLLAQVDQRQPLVLKFARSSQIEVEEANYQAYIAQQMPAPFAAQQMNVVKFWDIGGVVYTFMGAGAHVWPTFSDHYHRTDDPEKILRPLRFFFQVMWESYYRQSQWLPARTLFACYEPVFELGTHERKVNEFYEQVKVATHLPLIPYSPLTWVLNHAARSRFPAAQQVITHGDLHGDNLFVDGDRMWAIDFERTGPGHSLRDFAELEVDILTRLVARDTVDDVAFYQLARQLVSVALDGAGESATIQMAASAEKAVAVVHGLRQIAQEITRFSEQEYLWASLLDALFVASISSAPAWQRQRALIFSSVIVERLR